MKEEASDTVTGGETAQTQRAPSAIQTKVRNSNMVVPSCRRDAATVRMKIVCKSRYEVGDHVTTYVGATALLRSQVISVMCSTTLWGELTCGISRFVCPGSTYQMPGDVHTIHYFTPLPQVKVRRLVWLVAGVTISSVEQGWGETTRCHPDLYYHRDMTHSYGSLHPEARVEKILG